MRNQKLAYRNQRTETKKNFLSAHLIYVSQAKKSCSLPAALILICLILPQVLAGFLNIVQYIDPKYSVAESWAWHWADPSLPSKEDPPAFRLLVHGAQPTYYWSTPEGIEQTRAFANSGNREISVYDASLATRYAAGLISLTEEQIDKADVDGDVTEADAKLIAGRAIDSSVVFPVEG